MAAVSLRIELDENNVIKGIQDIGDAAENMGGKFRKSGQDGNVVFKELAKGQKQAADAASGLMGGLAGTEGGLRKVGQRGNLVLTGMQKDTMKAREAAMLLSNTLGVQLPAGLEKVLSKLPGVSGALTAVFKASIVLAVASAVIGLVNNFDSLKLKISDAGYQLALFGDHVRSIFGMGNQDILLGETVKKQQQLLIPVIEAREQAERKASLAGREGAAVIREQTKQAQVDLDRLANTQKDQVVKTFSDQQKINEAVRLIDKQTAEARIAVEKAANLEIAKQRRALANQNAAEADAIHAIGTTGATTILMNRDAQLATLERNRKLQGLGDGDPLVQEQRTNIINRANQEILKMYDDYVDEAYNILKAGEVESATGIAQIDADAAAQRVRARIEELRKFGGLPPEALERIGAEKRLAEIVAQIDAQAAKKKELLHKATSEQITQMETAAAIASLPEWQRGEAQIIADHAERVRRIEEDLRTTVIDETEAARARRAVNQELNARLIDEHRRMAEQLGADLESAFDDMTSGNLGKRILNNMKKLFFQILAAWMQSVGAMQSGFGQVIGGLLFGTSQGSGGFLTNLFGGASARPGGSTSVPGVTSATPGSAFWGVGSTGDSMMSPGSVAMFSNSVAQSNPAFRAAFGSGPETISSPITGSVGGVSSLGSTITSSRSAMGLLGGLGALGANAIGSKFGGNAGSLGVMLLTPLLLAGMGFGGASLAMTNAMVQPLMAMGMSATVAASVLAGIGGGMLGFGVGSKYGKVAGGLSGGATGALTGFMFGGPAGALIGGLIGLLGGVFGGMFGGARREKQANAIANQVNSQIKDVLNSYKTFQSDYGSSLSSLESIRAQAEEQLNQLKNEGRSVYSHKVSPAIGAALSEINSTEAERTRRSGLGFSPPMFHNGGLVGGPGISGGRIGNGEVMAILREGERVMNPRASARNAGTLDAMNAGLNGGGGAGASIYIENLNAMDAKSFQQWLSQEGGKGFRAYQKQARAEGQF